MNTALVSKGILSDNCLVGLRLDPRYGRDQTAAGIDFSGVDIGFKCSKHIRSDPQRHDDLFQRGVTGTLTQTIDGALYLPGTTADTLQRVGNCESKVIVVMD